MVETFKNYNEEVEVSNLGNVKKNGKLMIQHKDANYYYVVLGQQAVRVHTMVGICFPEICGEYKEGWHFHHINEDQLDNRAENIVCVSPSEHMKLHRKEDGVSVPVKAYDGYGNFVGRWDSKTKAAEETGVDYRHISEMIRGDKHRRTVGGLVWVLADATEEEVAKKLAPVQERMKKRELRESAVNSKVMERKQRWQNKMAIAEKKRESKIILEYDEFGNLLQEWKNIDEAAKFHKVNNASIYNNLNGRTLYLKKGGKRVYFQRKQQAI